MTDVQLIIGPPGTGKSTALTRTVQEHAIGDGNNVAICSLTRTAANEIRGLVPLPDDNVGTMHAHAWRALDRPRLAETPEGIKAWNEDNPDSPLTTSRGGGADDLDGDRPEDEKTDTAQLHQDVQNRLASMTPQEQWTDAERNWYARWCDWKQQTRRRDFHDLIVDCIADGLPHPSSPAVLLGDEAQDFSRAELTLFRVWARHAQLAIIAADPDQTIYAWRGADPDAFMRIPDRDVRVLDQSYRVPRAVHAAAVRWVRQIERRRDPVYRPRDDDGACEWLGASTRETDHLTDSIVADLDGGSSVMLLASCGYMLTGMVAALRDAAVPFHNPLRPEHGAWNPMRAAARLAAYNAPRVAERPRMWTWGELHQWIEPLQARAFPRGTKSFIEAKVLEDRFGESAADQAISPEQMCDLLGVADTADAQLDLDHAAGEAADHPAFRYDLDWYERNLLASARRRMTYPIALVREHGFDVLRRPPRLTVGTIHSVKGGEADVVYLAPDLSRTAYWHGWHHGGAARDHIIRTFYVGLTRARCAVRLLDPATPMHIAPTELTQ